jgi:NitT/TauT family transport system substrate-binding protein/sulfonate transport system substrate-binding protein
MFSRRSILGLLPAALAGAPILSMAAAEPARSLRIGYQKGGPILIAAKQNRSVETCLQPLGIDVQWLEFPYGPPLLEAMRIGSIDIGAVGNTPPIFAQAAHADLVYIAAVPSGASGIIVPPGSELQTLHDLKGQKVAFARGSAAQNLTIAALEKAGLSYRDIEPLYLAPADAAAAFEHRSIDAWTIWDPFFAIYENKPGVRVLAGSQEIGPQNSFLVGSGPYVAANAGIVTKVIEEFGKVAHWAVTHREDVARLLSEETGVPLEAMVRTVDRNPLTIEPITDEIVHSQQELADRFYNLGIIPTAIRVADQMWHPPSGS